MAPKVYNSIRSFEWWDWKPCHQNLHFGRKPENLVLSAPFLNQFWTKGDIAFPRIRSGTTKMVVFR